MFKGFYAASSAMIAQQRRTDLLTNNLANANTPGFKADQASLRAFPDMLLQRMNNRSFSKENGDSATPKETLGSINTGVYMQENMPNFLQGDLRETKQPTDFAILDGNLPADEKTGRKGTLFFTVQGEDGKPRYTRDGKFTLDGQGFLTTNQGNYVLDEKGAKIQLQSANFQVGNDGTIMENNQQVARVGLAYAQDPMALEKEGNGYYHMTNNQALPSALTANGVSFQVHQGFIEGSNVDMSQTMTELLTTYRSFEANQKILQAYDRSMDRAVNEVGRLR
ncbi:flagellar hook-basal body protein [Priestia koreensis]|uniref:flagellar hook-basal body protein n=1 Tax=Priestia koreensis TaxID=284581 RepID=UPI001F567B75|nr:flagellar hook-basal body protein [Priestia koreensis]UNL84855.1 flagellar hook-basal body protein [Priestia koreensis]